MNERFVSEPIEPAVATFDTRRMAAGEPGLPGEFVWRGQGIRLVKVLREWRETGPCRNGSNEHYVRKYWYEAEDTEGRLLKIYFERSARSPRRLKAGSRWRLYSLRNAPGA